MAFLGLYGTGSPLPNFYSEDLLDEQSGSGSASRDFLDLLNGAIYPLHFAGWARHRLFYALVEAAEPAALERLFCRLGFPADPGPARRPLHLLRYLGLFAMASRPVGAAPGMESEAAIASASARWLRNSFGVFLINA